MRPEICDHPANLLQLQGNIERVFISEGGYFLILGWVADEGHRSGKFEIIASQALVEIPFPSILRHARPDIETHVREGAYDYGFIAFGRTPGRREFQKPLVVRIASDVGLFEASAIPEIIADKRLLDTFLIVTAGTQCHAGKDVMISHFLQNGAAGSLVELFSKHVERGISGHQAFRFKPRPVKRSFVTVLFGSAEPALLQPVLFRDHADIGEWIYVCNSPEDSEAVLNYCRVMSELYDLPITAILLTDNVGFGAANNLAVGHAVSDNIFLINPDVYPMAEHNAALACALGQERRGALRGGLLFYDPDTLMHSGMYVDSDPVMRVTTINQHAGSPAMASFNLLRVEHFDKSVPFDASEWNESRVVQAITGATMAFDRRDFERIGGFSLNYVYGHYEDADLSLRWADMGGTVEIDPHLRLIHLEGQGSRAKGPQYHAAAVINRHLFSISHGHRMPIFGVSSPPFPPMESASRSLV